MWWDDDQPPYSMIGVQTTLPTDPNKRYPKSRPIGFIWPKNNDNRARKQTRAASPAKAGKPKGRARPRAE